MSKPNIKLRTGSACRVTRLERDRFNEAAAAGTIPCLPKTTPGRARLFDDFALLSLWYYRELVEDGYTRDKAGSIACLISECARQNPEASVISYVENYFHPVTGECYPFDQVPDPSTWDTHVFNGTDIRKVTNFRVGKARKMIAHYRDEELSVQGTED